MSCKRLVTSTLMILLIVFQVFWAVIYLLNGLIGAAVSPRIGVMSSAPGVFSQAWTFYFISALGL